MIFAQLHTYDFVRPHIYCETKIFVLVVQNKSFVLVVQNKKEKGLKVIHSFAARRYKCSWSHGSVKLLGEGITFFPKSHRLESQREKKIETNRGKYKRKHSTCVDRVRTERSRGATAGTRPRQKTNFLRCNRFVSRSLTASFHAWQTNAN